MPAFSLYPIGPLMILTYLPQMMQAIVFDTDL